MTLLVACWFSFLEFRNHIGAKSLKQSGSPWQNLYLPIPSTSFYIITVTDMILHINANLLPRSSALHPRSKLEWMAVLMVFLQGTSMCIKEGVWPGVPAGLVPVSVRYYWCRKVSETSSSHQKFKDHRACVFRRNFWISIITLGELLKIVFTVERIKELKWR